MSLRERPKPGGVGRRPTRRAPGFGLSLKLNLELSVGVALFLRKVVPTLSRSTAGQIEVRQVAVERFHCVSYPPVNLYPDPLFRISSFVFLPAIIAIR